MNQCQICRCPLEEGARTYRLGMEGNLKVVCRSCKNSFLLWVRSCEENGLDNLRAKEFRTE